MTEVRSGHAGREHGEGGCVGHGGFIMTMISTRVDGAAVAGVATMSRVSMGPEGTEQLSQSLSQGRVGESHLGLC